MFVKVAWMSRKKVRMVLSGMRDYRVPILRRQALGYVFTVKLKYLYYEMSKIVVKIERLHAILVKYQTH